MDRSKYPQGTISVDEAIKIISTDSKTNMTVDIQRMINAIPFLREDSTFSLFQGHVEPNVPTVFGLKKNIFVVDSVKPIWIRTGFEGEEDMVRLRRAMMDHYKELSGRDLNVEEIGLRTLETTADGDKGMSVTPRKNTTSKTKAGDVLEAGHNVVEGK